MSQSARQRFLFVGYARAKQADGFGMKDPLADQTKHKSSTYQARKRVPWLAVPIILGAMSLLTAGYLMSSTEVSIADDAAAKPITLRTHQRTVEGVLREAGVSTFAEDVVSPALASEVKRGESISIKRALPVQLQIDEQEPRLIRTQSRAVPDMLRAIGESVGAQDAIFVNNESTLSLNDAAGKTGLGDVAKVQVKRAVELNVQETGKPNQHLATTADTVGEALMQTGNIIYLADIVKPALQERVKAGMTISIQRSRPVSVLVDGRRIRTRTQQKTVSDLLAELNIALYDEDYTKPALNTPVNGDMEVKVVRLRREVVVEQTLLPFDTRWQADPNLELDNQELAQEGAPGVHERRTLVTLEDGATVKKELVADFVARDIQPKIYTYGTKIVVRTVNTASGQIQYWRKFKVLATSYSAANAGVSPSSPWYGITRCGIPMRTGIVAVDTNLIPLRTNLYVDGYGTGLACDTGGGIKGKHIDLGYADAEYTPWFRYVDVYILTPVPANVKYVLDN